MQRLESFLIRSAWLPVLLLLGIWLWVSGLEGWSAIGAAWLLLIPIILSTVYWLLGIWLIFRYTRHKSIPPLTLKLSVLLNTLPLALVFIRILYLEISRSFF